MPRLYVKNMFVANIRTQDDAFVTRVFPTFAHGEYVLHMCSRPYAKDGRKGGHPVAERE